MLIINVIASVYGISQIDDSDQSLPERPATFLYHGFRALSQRPYIPSLTEHNSVLHEQALPGMFVVLVRTTACRDARHRLLMTLEQETFIAIFSLLHILFL